MPLLKQDTVLSNDITLTAGGSNVNSDVANTRTTRGRMVLIKITNGTTAPATPASADIQVSGDGQNFYSWQIVTGSGTNGATKTTSLFVPVAAMYIRVVWTPGNNNDNVTARAEILQVAEASISLTEGAINDEFSPTEQPQAEMIEQLNNIYKELKKMKLALAIMVDQDLDAVKF